jgi:hypothetical protein
VEVVDANPGPDPAEQGNDHGTDPGPAGEADPAGGAGHGVRAPAPDEAATGGDADQAGGQAGADQSGEAGAEHPDGKDPLRFNHWMKRSATGAVLTGIAIGLQQALETPKKQPAFVIVASDEPDGSDGPIELRFDPDSPAGTVAIIRRSSDGGDPEAPAPPS